MILSLESKEELLSNEQEVSSIDFGYIIFKQIFLPWTDNRCK